jgi:sugar lactone lactonase YvrE
VLAAGVVAVSTEDTIATIAGSGRDGVPEDGGQATSSSLRSPSGVAVDGAGNVYLVDSLTGVWKVTADGVIVGFAGTKQAGAQGDDDVGDGGPAIEAMLTLASDVAVDGAGNVYIADLGNDRVRKVTGGIIATVAGGGTSGLLGDGKPATLARLDAPSGIALDEAGNLYIADRDHHRVRRVSPDGVITTVAGTGTGGDSGDGGQATSAQLRFPTDVAVDGAGNLYIADSGNHRVRKVTGGIITTVAGTGAAGLSGDGGPAGSAQLNTPQALALDRSGDLYIADSGNHRVRRVSPAGVITTVAGTGVKGFSGDGGPAGLAQLANPLGVALDRAGNLYIADTGNRRVRRVAASAASADSAAPGEGAGPGASPAGDTVVEADAIGAVATRSRRGLRLVRVELEAEERLSARLVLVRNGKTLASKRFAAVKPGSRVLTLGVPRRVTKGRATVRVELSDAAGNARAFRRGVAIPVAGRA